MSPNGRGCDKVALWRKSRRNVQVHLRQTSSCRGRRLGYLWELRRGDFSRRRHADAPRSRPTGSVASAGTAPREKRTDRSSVPAMVLNLGPECLELEVGTVVDVVAAV